MEDQVTITSPLLLDETGKAIVEAITQTDVTQQRIREIATAVETKTEEQLNRIPEVTALSDEISSLKGALDVLDKSIYRTADDGISIDHIPGVKKYDGFISAAYLDNIVRVASSSTYDTYAFIAEKDMSIYTLNVDANYFSICHGVHFSKKEIVSETETRYNCDSAVRVRKSEGNLPTESSKLVISAGDAVVFSITKGMAATIYGYPMEKRVNESFKQAVKTQKDMYLCYIEEPGDDQSTERIEVYQPSNVGYVKYVICHSVQTLVNVDCWRMGYAIACTDDFTERYPITTKGEWECAIHLKDRDDFSGGITHGDEIMTHSAFFIDGCIADVAQYKEPTKIKSFNLVQHTNMYDPNDHTTIIAEHGTNHIFSNRCVSIEQSLRWLSDYTVTQCYMAMHLPAKVQTNMWHSDYDYTPMEIGNNPEFNRKGATKVWVYDTDGNVNTSMHIAKYPTGYYNGDHLLLTDNDNNAYNKCYFVITNSSAGTEISSGTVWRTETIYEFNISR